MQHGPDAFLKPDYADVEIADVVGYWLADLAGRPASPATVRTYGNAVLSFTKSLTLQGKPHTLASITESNVTVWKTHMRGGLIQPAVSGKQHHIQRVQGAYSPATIRAYLIVLKVFCNRYLKRRYSAHDLLEFVELGKLNVEPKEAFTSAEREKLLTACDGATFEMIRDRAFVQLMLATACRFKEIHGLSISSLDLDAKRMWVVLKGGRQVPVDIDGKALRDLRIYCGRRRLVAGTGVGALWTSDGGKPLTYWGAYGIFNRLEQRSGVKCNPHKFRHTVAQVAAQAGAPVADVQDLLHHSSSGMARRYIGNARQDVAAGLAKQYSLAG